MFKEDILSQIQVILNSVQSIVSHISQSESSKKCQCQNNDDLWWEKETFVYADSDMNFDQVSYKSETLSDCCEAQAWVRQGRARKGKGWQSR